MNVNAHRLAATLKEDGTLFLQGLPFQSGERVEVIILASPTEAGDRGLVAMAQNDLSLADEVTEDYLAAVAATLTEWDSPADDLAYQDL